MPSADIQGRDRSLSSGYYEFRHICKDRDLILRLCFYQIQSIFAFIGYFSTCNLNMRRHRKLVESVYVN